MLFHILLAILPLQTDANTALDHFINRRKVLNFTFTVINETGKIVWIECAYNFEEIVAGDVNETSYDVGKLAIGILVDRQQNRSFKNELNHHFDRDLYEIMRNEFNFDFSVVHLPNKLDILDDVDVLLCEDNDKNQICQNYSKRTFPVLESHYYLIYRKNYAKYSKDIYIITFVGSLWFCYLVLLLLLAICLKIATKYSLMRAKSSENWSWVDISLWAIAAACQQGLSFTPTKFCSRLIFLLGYLASYLLYTGFAAGITSVLLNQNRDDTINLNHHKGNLISYPNSHLAIRTVKDVAELFEEIERNKAIGILPKRYVNNHLWKSKNYNLQEQITFVKLPIVHGTGFLLKDDILTRRINKKIIQYKERGLLKRTLRHNSLITVEESGYSRVSLEHVYSAILLLTFGILLAIFCLICEFLSASISKKQQQPIRSI